MTFERFAATVQDWIGWMTPAQVSSATASILPITDLPRGTTLDQALAVVARGEPAPMPDGEAEPETAPPPKRQAPRKSSKAKSGTGAAVAR